MATRVTKKAWFGPKRLLGWGWSPVSWEGWIVSAGFIVLTVTSVVIWPGPGALIAVAVLLGLLLLIVVLTGDAPGGPKS